MGPLAVSLDNYPLVYNFGHHQKPGPKKAAQQLLPGQTQTFPPGFLDWLGPGQRGRKRTVLSSAGRSVRGRNNFSSNFVGVLQSDRKERGQRNGSPDCVDIISEDDDVMEYDDNNDGMIRDDDNDGDDATVHISPLITAEMFFSSQEEVLEMVNVFDKPWRRVSPGQGRLEVAYDVYTMGYKRNGSRPPDYRVLVADYHAQVPSQRDLRQLEEALPHGVPIIVAVVSEGNASFFFFANI